MTLLVTAHMASPIAGDAPQFDAILECEMSQRMGLAHRVRNDGPAPEIGSVHIPMVHRTIGGVRVACCSSPIYAAESESVERIAKRLSIENASELAPDARLVVAMGNALYKSYHLPLRIRHTPRICWFVWGHRRPINKLLKSVQSLGKKRSIGYGRVARWELVNIPPEQCYFWFAESPQGPVLMRPLPWCNELPSNLIGYRRDFASCQPPYWHSARFQDVVVPC